MICDAEFWVEVRRKRDGGNAIFTAMLSLLHSRQMALASAVEVDEDDNSFLPSSIIKPISQEPLEGNKVFRLPNSKGPERQVSVRVLRVLQQIMMFAVPLYSLQYNIPAMSMSAERSCIIDGSSKKPIVFGAGKEVKIPQHLRGLGCIVADDYLTILTNQGEVWASGGLNMMTYEDGVWSSAPIKDEGSMTNIAGKVLMLVGAGDRLACITCGLTVRPLSTLSKPVRSVMPFRQVRYLAMGYGEDYYMVGMDSVLYKTVASQRTLGTPRRVMAFSRTAVSRVASGSGFYLVIDQNGQLYTLGRNKKGQLGNGEKHNVRRKPFLHKYLRHHFIVMAAAGESHSLAITSSGVAYGAGSNEHGELGLGESVMEALQFTKIPLPSRCVGIAAGPASSMFACEDGHVYTCGSNENGQLGLDTSDVAVHTPSRVPSVTAGVETYTMDFGGYRRSHVVQNQVVPSTSLALPGVSDQSESQQQQQKQQMHKQPVPREKEVKEEQCEDIKDNSIQEVSSSSLQVPVVKDIRANSEMGQVNAIKQEKALMCGKCCSVM